MAWECFMVEQTDRVRRWLRRYTSPDAVGAWTCEGGWHEAMAQIEDGPAIRYSDEHHEDLVRTEPMSWPRDDPRWPTECGHGCGYRFTGTDEWQLFYEVIYRAPAQGGRELLIRDDLDRSAVGAMWWARWLPRAWWGPEGQGCLCVVTPGGMWPIDGPASRPGGGESAPGAWTRTGEPPAITVAPSINLVGRYHGFLRDGVLTDDVEGRRL